MYYDSNIDPIGLDLIKNEQEYKPCCMDNQSYKIEEMACDKDENLWIHSSNIELYLKQCEPYMLSEDFEVLKNNLLKQVR